MTITTLHKVTPGRSNYYTISIAKDDYYTDNGEASGRWYGSGARELGLEGSAIAYRDAQYQRVVTGIHPFADQLLRRVDLKPRTYKGSGSEPKVSHPVVGYDFTFSAPKSLSILYATASQATRQQIDASLEQATAKALDYLGDNLCYTRSGRGGKQRERARPIFAAFNHTTSRSLDPQLHTHAVLVNSAQRPDGTWGAIDASQFLGRDKTKEILQTAAAIHANELRLQLEVRLKLVTVSSEHNQTFHIQGVPLSLQIELSKRSRLIEARIKEEFTDHGIEPNAKDRQRIVLETREKKREITFEERIVHWQGIAREFRFNPDRLPTTRRTPEKLRHWQDLTDKVSAELHRQDATITRQKILLEAARASGGRFETEDLRLFAQGYFDHYTKTIAVQGQEKRVLDRDGIKAVRDYWTKQAKTAGYRPDLSKLGSYDRSMLGKAIDKLNELRQVRSDYIRERRRRQLERLKRQAPLLYITGKIDLKTYKALTRKPPQSKVAIEVLYATHQISSAQRKYYLALLDERQRKLENQKKVDRLLRAEALYKAGELDRQSYDDIRRGNFSGEGREEKGVERELSFLDRYLHREEQERQRAQGRQREQKPSFLERVLGKERQAQPAEKQQAPPKVEGAKRERRKRGVEIDL
jgi:conjugative relaxase-like TrwC/TraI family protein